MTGSLRGLHLHFDPVSGIAGDMTVAALVDLGVPERVVTDAVAAMKVKGLRVGFDRRKKGAFAGRGFVVDFPRPSAAGPSAIRAPRAAGARPGHDHRDYAEIRRLLDRAALDEETRALAHEIFARIAEVEAALHGTPVAKVSFHEVGAFDSIADIVGAAAALVWLAPVSVSSSPPVLGTGRVGTAHGIVAVPAPATAALLAGVPVLSEGEGELTTPTGAAILAAICQHFGAAPPMELVAVGYGAGTRELADRPNVLRVLAGAPVGEVMDAPAASVLVLQANIDDMNPQLMPGLLEALLEAGAVDAWATPILMKKGRPAFAVAAMCEAGWLDPVRRALFENSTTLGLRISQADRSVLERSRAAVATRFGKIGVKVSAWEGRILHARPEFEDCKAAAARAKVPVRVVEQAAVAAAQRLVAGPDEAPAGRRASRARRTR